MQISFRLASLSLLRQAKLVTAHLSYLVGHCMLRFLQVQVLPPDHVGGAQHRFDNGLEVVEVDVDVGLVSLIGSVL